MYLYLIPPDFRERTSAFLEKCPFKQVEDIHNRNAYTRY